MSAKLSRRRTSPDPEEKKDCEIDEKVDRPPITSQNSMIKMSPIKRQTSVGMYQHYDYIMGSNK
jgi:hypothetical protein